VRGEGNLTWQPRQAAESSMADRAPNVGPSSPSLPPSILKLQLLGGFQVTEGGRSIDLPNDAQKLVAFLALQTREVPRPFAAGRLWLDSDQDRALGNLRSALWRIRQRTHSLVSCQGDTLGISPDVEIDFQHLNRTAIMLFHESNTIRDQDLSIEPFIYELLPGWYDDWTLIERERVRQVSVHALEVIADHLTALGRNPEAVDAALAAIRFDPLRESAHRCLIRIHIREGNRSEALRQFALYRGLLECELGITPSVALIRLIETITDQSLVGSE